MVRDWLPQKAILEHPRVKLFYSHGGYNSMLEAVEAQVPMMISNTVRGDSLHNCGLVSKMHYGSCI